MEYSNWKIKKLADSLKNNEIEASVISAIMKGGEKVKKTDNNEKKAEWFYNAMQVMDKQLKPKVRHKVRQDCACCLGGKRHEICIQVNKNFKNTRDRLKAVNEGRLVFGHGVKEITDGKYEVSFFPEELETKKCPCLKGLTKAMPITYCYCCGGHVKYHLENVLGKKMSVKVLGTLLSTAGKKGCRFELKEV